MKNKVLVALIIMVAILTIFMAGCKNKIEDKIVENTIEDVTGGKVDIGKDTTTISIPQGTAKVGDNIKWPKDKMGNLPEVKANFISVLEDKNYGMIMLHFEKMKEDDAKKYIENINELGFETMLENSTSDGFMYSGKMDSGLEVMFQFYKDGTGSLYYSEKPIIFNGSPQGSNNTSAGEDIDMSDDVPWPQDFFKDLPELEGKITGITSSGNTEKYIYLEYVEKQDALDYIEKIKEAGFISSPSESMSGDYLSYESGNDNGDYIVFTWSSSENASITMIKGE